MNCSLFVQVVKLGRFRDIQLFKTVPHAIIVMTIRLNLYGVYFVIRFVSVNMCTDDETKKKGRLACSYTIYLYRAVNVELSRFSSSSSFSRCYVRLHSNRQHAPVSFISDMTIALYMPLQYEHTEKQYRKYTD